MRCCNHIPTVHVFLPRHNSIERLGWDLEGSASKLLTCIHCKDRSVSPSYDGQITWFMAHGKAEKQPFQMHSSLHQHLFSVQRYSSNTGQVQNMSTLLEVTVYLRYSSFLIATSREAEPIVHMWEKQSRQVTGLYYNRATNLTHQDCKKMIWLSCPRSFDLPPTQFLHYQWPPVRVQVWAGFSWKNRAFHG